MIKTRSPIPFALLLATAPLAAQERTTVETAVEGGKVTVSYSPTDLRGRSAKDLPAGEVWRMSAGEAALLRTDVPLLVGTMVLAPGEHRLSARHNGQGNWELVVFQGASLFEPGMTHRAVPIELSPEEKGQEKLSFTVDNKKGDLAFRAQWGEESLRWGAKALGVTKMDEKLGDKPATFTFFNIPSNEAMHRQVQGSNPIHIGMVEVKGAQPVVYDMVAKRDGRGVKITLTNTTLTKTEAALASAKRQHDRITERLKTMQGQQAENLGKRRDQLATQIASFEATQAEAKTMPKEITLDAAVEMSQNRAEGLLVSAEKADNGLKIQLRFGQRTATTSIENSAFGK
jgi:hypothetical protein